MNPDDPGLDRELARRFQELRRGDEAAAPDLDRLLDRPRRGRTSRRRLAFAAAVVVLLAAALLFRRAAPPGSRDALPPAAASLAAWRSPTGSLLHTPGAELWARVPALVPPVPVFASVSIPQTTKGVAR
jgi:hypothetical protein